MKIVRTLPSSFGLLNPRGYVGAEVLDEFQPGLVVEV